MLTVDYGEGGLAVDYVINFFSFLPFRIITNLTILILISL